MAYGTHAPSAPDELAGQPGSHGLPENDLIRGFCERCRAEGLPLSRGMVFIDTLHPIFEGRGFRWNDTETNESDVFEYGSTSEGDAARELAALDLLSHARKRPRGAADRSRRGATLDF